MKSKKPAHNRSVNASPPSAARATQNASRGFAPLWHFAPPHFFAPVKCFAFSLSGAKKRRLPPERYAQVAQMVWIYIDKKI